MVTPLKLKSERVGKTPLASELPYISVLVDTGVFHLDQSYDYALPAKFDLQPGEWVSVPFNGQSRTGLIIERKATAQISKILPINRRIKGPFIDQTHLNLYKAIAKRWAAPIFDVLRFAKELSVNTQEKQSQTPAGKREYLQLNSDSNESIQLLQIAHQLAKSGSTLVIVPEARIVKILGEQSFSVAMRGGILTSNRFQNIIILREESEHHYEIKSPGFNTRDVALLRNELLGENIYFVGFSPSLEMTRLIENKYVKFRKGNGRVNVIAKPSLQGELIPSAMISQIKSEISKGPLLVVVPSKGYGLAISCAACRNIAHCDCGGKLSKRSRNEDPSCSICMKIYSNWHCRYCQNQKIYLLGRGIERIAEEFGKSFINTPIHISTAEKSIDLIDTKRVIVLATVGAVPNVQFRSVLFLDGLNLGADMRSEERYLSTLFRYSAQSSGSVFIVNRTELPAINSLIRWNPNTSLTKLLRESTEADLPPAFRHALIRTEESESARIYTGFLASIRDGRLPITTRIYNLENGLISLFFNLKGAALTTEFIYNLQKKRSIAGKKLLKVRIDPYLL
mgnify:CR=1 FL=1